jgi:UDP-N-acetylmuramoylalanine--D-glutamate ligase
MIKINLNNEIISLFNKKEIKLPGKHNLENFLAAICACSYFLKNDFEKFIKAIRFAAENFGGTEHRLEFVREISGVKFYNDSIATSPTRVIKGALSVFSDKNVVLIAGGYDKNLPFDELGDVICQKVKVLVLFGSSSSKINAAVKSSKILNKPSVYECSAMEEAVRSAYNKAAEGDVVLFSPACAAFDLYQNFEERGRHFKRAVQDIK